MKSQLQIFAAVFSVLLEIAGCSSERTVSAKAPEVVSGLAVTQIQQQTVPDLFSAVGTVRSARSAQISAEIMGRVTAVRVHEGDTVKQGAVLAVLEDIQPRTGLEQARAALNAADHELASAESERTLAQATFARLKKLYDEKSISPQEFDEINARVQSATSRREAADAARAQAAAAVQQARIVLDRTRILAPFDGLVTERHIDPGTLATPGLPLFTVESGGRYRLEANVNESELKYVHLGAASQIAFDSLEGKPFGGKVVEIVPAADPLSRSFVVKIELPENKNLRSGIFGRAAFARGQKQTVLVPRSAVLERGQLQSVFALDASNFAALRYVTLGESLGNQAEVLSGLAPGDRVVSDPGGRDLAGKRIEVK